MGSIGCDNGTTIPKNEPGNNTYGDVDFAEMFGLSEFIPKPVSRHVKIEPSAIANEPQLAR